MFEPNQILDSTKLLKLSTHVGTKLGSQSATKDDPSITETTSQL
jgi:hypothetical protein